MTRVLLFATHPYSSNGYSKIAFELAKELATKQDIQLTYYGFQNFQKNEQHNNERSLPQGVQVYDAFANEKNKQMGFGFEEVTDFVTLNKPDVCIIYNDMGVVSSILEGLKKVQNRKFKIMIYMDQVYLCQRKEYIKRLNEEVDFVICFSKFWEDCVKGQGLVKPTGILEHGFNPAMHYPIPRRLARMYFNLKEEDFIIINANRNQPRKRLDIMMMAFAEVVSRHITDPIKLLIATAPNGAWNLIEIYERELGLRGVSLEDGMKHIIFIDNPQGLTDEDINTLFNASDVGINTAMGEGWGLCNFEAAACGVPQIVPAIGGFLDFFDKTNSIMIQPKIKVYTDMSIDGCPGCAEICDYVDFADAIDVYYNSEELRKKHGENARKHILKNYRWKDLGDKLYKHILKVAEKTQDISYDSSVSTTSKLFSLDDLEFLNNDLNKNLNISLLQTVSNIDAKQPITSSKNTSLSGNVVDIESNTLSQNTTSANIEPVTTPVSDTPISKPLQTPFNSPVVTPVSTPHQSRANEIKNRLKSKLAKKQAEKKKIIVVEESSEEESIDKEELLKLRSKIDKLLSKA
jgi:glycosyltransferase involved in cell wall biosynthesis